MRERKSGRQMPAQTGAVLFCPEPRMGEGQKNGSANPRYTDYSDGHTP